MHETTGSPSTRTVHAPHSASSQPIFVPVRRSRSRSSVERVSPGTASKECCLPFTEMFMFDIPIILFCALPRCFKHILEQLSHNMPAIIRACAAGAGAKTDLSKQSFESSIKGFIVEGFADQGLFCFGATPGGGSARAHSNADLANCIAGAFEPDRNVDDGQCHSLRTHDPFEAGGLSFLGERQIKTDEQFL